ncbi:TetR/AcrR family transcriptional regulator [Georgenia sp. SUBG003]|uniref:TetR/AcrR family transcriptional regulator n=1 Tax=Georgenia sp. SUBG003 TaxID=1497974 RepID=UPI003AB5F7DC
MCALRPYHHGDLRRAVLDAAVATIPETGPAGLSMRDLARRAGVSHAAPAHHFGDKAGLLTAVAAEGYDLLARVLVDAQHRTGDFLELGVAYVRFAVEHRAHFEVMFRPDLYHPDDPELLAARERAGEALYGGAGALPSDRRGGGLASRRRRRVVPGARLREPVAHGLPSAGPRRRPRGGRARRRGAAVPPALTARSGPSIRRSTSSRLAQPHDSEVRASTAQLCACPCA